MGRDRLYHRVRRLHFDRRRARRPPRRQTDFHGGLCDLHVGVARLRAGAVGGVPDRRAVRAGPGGGDPGAELDSLTLLNHAYADPKERGRAVGFWAAGASVALTAGPFVGGVLIALVGWRSIFLVNLPIGAAGLWLAWRYAEETPRLAQREIDLPGQIAAITALGVLAGALIEGGRLGWSHPLVFVGFAAAAV